MHLTLKKETTQPAALNFLRNAMSWRAIWAYRLDKGSCTSDVFGRYISKLISS
jgi:hypothetical protein